MPFTPDAVLSAVHRVVTRDGATLEQIADSFHKAEGPDEDGQPFTAQRLAATLAALSFAGKIYRSGDRYHTFEVGGPGEPFDWRTVPAWQRPIDLPFPSRHLALTPWQRQVAGLIWGHRADPRHAGRLVYPYRDGHPDYGASGIHIAFAPGGELELDDATKARVLDQIAKIVPDPGRDDDIGFQWTIVSDRVMTGVGNDAGEWTLIYLTDSPPNRDSGPGWYVYGPDLAAIRIGGATLADVLNAVEHQVRSYVQLRRSQIEAQGTGPLVSDELRAAIHAGHVTEVVIFCDRCGVKHRGDFVGATREDRSAAARQFLENRKGWLCREDDLCPVCRTS